MMHRAASLLLAVLITAAALWFLAAPATLRQLRAAAGEADWWALSLAVLIG